MALFYAFKLLPKGQKTAKGKLDVVGSILFMFTIIPLFVALSEILGHGFTDPIILLGFLVIVIGLTPMAS